MNGTVLTPLAQQLQLSPTLHINELVHRQQSKGRRIVHLGFGESTFPIQRDVLQAYRDASRTTSYLPVAGLPKLREVSSCRRIPQNLAVLTSLFPKSIARFQSRRLGEKVNGDQIVVAPGSKPLLFALFDLLQGDVLLPRPSWVSYAPQVVHAGKKLFWVETDEGDRHTIIGV